MSMGRKVDVHVDDLQLHKQSTVSSNTWYRADRKIWLGHMNLTLRDGEWSWMMGHSGFIPEHNI